jgi:hypothetical protein
VTGTADTQDRPALRRGLTIVPVGEGLLVEGGARRCLLKGTALRQVLPAVPLLLPLLDGEHDRDSVCAAAGIGLADLDAVLDQLISCDALEPAATARRPAPHGPGHVATFLSRAADKTGGGGHVIAAHLAGSAVVICAPKALAEQIAADLQETGVGSATAAESLEAIPDSCLRQASSAGSGIAAIFDGGPGGEHGALADAVARCWGNGMPVLRFASHAALEVGPVFRHGAGVCHACFERGYQALWLQRDAGHARPGEVTGFDPLAGQGMLAALVTAELLSLLSGFGTVTTARGLSRIFAPGDVVERYDALPEPDCAGCGGWTQADGAIGGVEAYEWAERREPECGESRPAARPRRNTASPARDRKVTWAPRVPLADLCDPIVTQLLRRTDSRFPAAPGVRLAGPDPDDEIPSVCTFMLAAQSLPGSSATIFRYDSIAGELVAVRARPVSLPEALRSTDLDPADLAFALVLVASVGELRFRLGTLAPRQCHLDAGRIATDLSTTPLGLPISFASRWSKDLAGLMDLDPELEIVAAVAAVPRHEQEAGKCPL